MNSTMLGPTRSEAVIIIETIMVTVVTVMILVGNFITIVVLRSARCWEQNATMLLQNLALADFGVGLFMTWTAIYISGSDLDHWPYGEFTCNLCTFLGDVCCVVSILTLGLISVERYLLLTKPLKYPRYMTSQSIIILSTLTWLIAMVLFIPSFLPEGSVYSVNSFICSFNFTGYKIVTIAAIFVIFLPANGTIIFTYGSTIRMAWRHHRSIKAQREVFGNVDESRQYNPKAINTFLMITGAFNLAWAPYVGLTVARNLSGGAAYPHWVEFLIPWLAMCNSLVNPIIYLVSNPPFRKQAQKLLYQKLLPFSRGTKVTPLM